MLLKLMRMLFAVLVAVAFGCLPTLLLASPATASPPLLCELAIATGEVAAPVQFTLLSHPITVGDADLGRIDTCKEPPASPLRE